MKNVMSALRAAREYFDNREGLSTIGHGPIPNEERRLLWLVDEAIAEVESHRNGALEEAAAIADQCAKDNKAEAAKQSRRAALLIGDPFGHSDMAASAADELQSCANEAEAIAALIRALKRPEQQP